MGDLEKENLAAVLCGVNDLKVQNVPVPLKPGPQGKTDYDMNKFDISK